MEQNACRKWTKGSQSTNLQPMRALFVLQQKMALKVEACKKMRKKEGSEKEKQPTSKTNPNGSNVVEPQEFLEEGDADNIQDDTDRDIDNNLEFDVKGNVCNVKIESNDLSTIVNGYPGDPIHLNCLIGFSHDKIFGSGGVSLDLFK